VYESVLYTLYTCYMFRPHMRPSLGRRITKNTYLKILHKLVEPMHWYKILNFKNTVEPGYNDIGLYDTSPIASDFLPYQLIPYC
jgi:hypothetical protein